MLWLGGRAVVWKLRVIRHTVYRRIGASARVEGGEPYRRMLVFAPLCMHAAFLMLFQAAAPSPGTPVNRALQLEIQARGPLRCLPLPVPHVAYLRALLPTASLVVGTISPSME